MSFKQQLIKINACQDTINWVKNRTIEQAWNDCHRGDWMLWLLEKMKGKEGWLDEKEIMLLGCWCARRTLKYVPEGEDRPLKAIEAKEDWTKGKITREEMNAAMAAAWDAASVAANAAANAAANTAASAVASDAASAAAWDAAWDAVSAAANAVASDTVSDTASAATWSAVSGTIASVTASDATRNVAYDKESLIQADYIRTQFTPPV